MKNHLDRPIITASFVPLERQPSVTMRQATKEASVSLKAYLPPRSKTANYRQQANSVISQTSDVLNKLGNAHMFTQRYNYCVR
jgi:hypothetical protein